MSNHLEVVPRIIDPSIAISYQSSRNQGASTTVNPSSQVLESVPTSDHVAIDVKEDATTQSSTNKSSDSFTNRFFNTLKDYTIPFVFTIIVIMIMYVIWKYWTTYRSMESATCPAVSNEAVDIKNKKPSNSELIDNVDLSKYVIGSVGTSDGSNLDSESESSSESEDGTDDGPNDDEDDDLALMEDSQEEDPDDECDNEDKTNQEHYEEPDLNAIAKLIEQPIDLNYDNIFSYTSSNNHPDKDSSDMFIITTQDSYNTLTPSDRVEEIVEDPLEDDASNHDDEDISDMSPLEDMSSQPKPAKKTRSKTSRKKISIL